MTHPLFARRSKRDAPISERGAKCMHRGTSITGETRYCQYPEGHKGEHSYHNEGAPNA